MPALYILIGYVVTCWGIIRVFGNLPVNVYSSWFVGATFFVGVQAMKALVWSRERFLAMMESYADRMIQDLDLDIPTNNQITHFYWKASDKPIHVIQHRPDPLIVDLHGSGYTIRNC